LYAILRTFAQTLRLAIWRCTQPFHVILQRLGSRHHYLIDDAELTQLLKDTGRWDDLLNGQLHCSHCQRALTPETISGFIVEDGKYQFFCDLQECLGARSRDE
jgi:hypothetical protein